MRKTLDRVVSLDTADRMLLGWAYVIQDTVARMRELNPEAKYLFLRLDTELFPDVEGDDN